jgi:hypothetical protein
MPAYEIRRTIADTPMDSCSVEIQSAAGEPAVYLGSEHWEQPFNDTLLTMLRASGFSESRFEVRDWPTYNGYTRRGIFIRLRDRYSADQTITDQELLDRFTAHQHELDEAVQRFAPIARAIANIDVGRWIRALDTRVDALESAQRSHHEALDAHNALLHELRGNVGELIQQSAEPTTISTAAIENHLTVIFEALYAAESGLTHRYQRLASTDYELARQISDLQCMLHALHADYVEPILRRLAVLETDLNGAR